MPPRVPGVRPVGARHADRVRRRHDEGAADVGRRAAGRSGRPQGRPFVGPAGKLLDRALDAAGIDRTRSTSPTWSSISSGSRAASGAFTRSRTAADCGVPSVARYRDCARQAAGDRLPRRHRGAGAARRGFKVTRIAANSSSRRWPRSCSRPCIPRRCYGLPMPRPAVARPNDSSTICGWSRARVHQRAKAEK